MFHCLHETRYWTQARPPPNHVCVTARDRSRQGRRLAQVMTKEANQRCRGNPVTSFDATRIDFSFPPRGRGFEHGTRRIQAGSRDDWRCGIDARGPHVRHVFEFRDLLAWIFCGARTQGSRQKRTPRHVAGAGLGYTKDAYTRRIATERLHLKRSSCGTAAGSSPRPYSFVCERQSKPGKISSRASPRSASSFAALSRSKVM